MRDHYVASSGRASAEDLVTTAAVVSGSALCRAWLVGPGDLCSTCAMAPECPDRRQCLHLAVSAGLTRRVDGPFRRFPFAAREVGRVATTLEALVLNDALAATGLADPAWLSLHGITAFGAFPMANEGRCVGVLAVFTRQPIDERTAGALAALARLAGPAFGDPAPRPAAPSMADVQRDAILRALAEAGGRVSGTGGAAEILGMKPTTLESRMRRLALRKPPRIPGG